MSGPEFEGSRSRVTRSPGALYSDPRRAGKKRRCDGHLAPERHWIDRGEPIVWSALPPGSDDIGNEGWWHAAFCADCAPVESTAALAALTTTDQEDHR